MNYGIEHLNASSQRELAADPEPSRLLIVVQHCADLIHELQRERGLSKLYLASHGERFAAALREQILYSRETEHSLRLCLSPSVAALASHLTGHAGLNTLAPLRQQVQLLACSGADAVAGYIRLIELLLTTVALVATATDAGLACRLTALLHLMRGKEYAGQERAIGSALFARGRHDSSTWQAIAERIAAQEQCFARFAEAASPAARELWQVCQQVSTLAELERLRGLLSQTPDGAALETGLSEVWFSCCSRRMNEIREFENRLLAELQQGCAPGGAGSALFSLH